MNQHHLQCIVNRQCTEYLNTKASCNAQNLRFKTLGTSTNNDNSACDDVECPSTHFFNGDGTTADVCTPLTTCKSNEYESTPSTIASDRQCTEYLNTKASCNARNLLFKTLGTSPNSDNSECDITEHCVQVLLSEPTHFLKGDGITADVCTEYTNMETKETCKDKNQTFTKKTRTTDNICINCGDIGVTHYITDDPDNTDNTICKKIYI